MSNQTPWWVTLENGTRGCIQAETAEAAKAKALELSGLPAVKCEVLPYPAEPRWHVETDPDPERAKKFGATPSFCYAPNECAGRGSCPKQRSCTD